MRGGGGLGVYWGGAQVGAGEEWHEADSPAPRWQ